MDKEENEGIKIWSTIYNFYFIKLSGKFAEKQNAKSFLVWKVMTEQIFFCCCSIKFILKLMDTIDKWC